MSVPPLRSWQTRAIEAYVNHNEPDFLVVATPGAGKTRVAGEIMRREFAAERIGFVVVVTPSMRLKFQWMEALAALDVQINPEHERGDFARMARDMHGIAVTYAQVAMSPELFRGLTARRRTLVTLDEIHHCGSERSWGDGIAHAFYPCVRRLSLSGTPWRTQREPIPFVRYVEGKSVPDFTYDYADALSDSPPVCRPVFFPRFGGEMAWSPQPGVTVSADFDEALSDIDANRRLRTAIDPSKNFLPDMLRDANNALREMRRDDHDAAGLVICDGISHADSVAGLLRHLGTDVEVVTSDVPDANERIDAFARGARPWLVAVAMVSEGVDIPRLRVGVFATVKLTELFFRQAVGRLVRIEPDIEAQDALMYIPDDERLRAHAERIKAQVFHVLDEQADELSRERELGERPPSTVVPLSAEAIAKGVLAGGETFTPEELARAERLKMLNPETAHLSTAQVAMLARAMGMTPPKTETPPTSDRPLHEIKKDLRRANSTAARSIALAYGLDFDLVQAKLNRLVGVRSVKAADERQLHARLAAAQIWLRDGEPPEAVYG